MPRAPKPEKRSAMWGSASPSVWRRGLGPEPERRAASSTRSVTGVGSAVCRPGLRESPQPPAGTPSPRLPGRAAAATLPCVATLRAVIFDLGGVVLGSPLHAIAHYEREIGIPSGHVNRVVGARGAEGAWARL